MYFVDQASYQFFFGSEQERRDGPPTINCDQLAVQLGYEKTYLRHSARA